MGHFTSSSLTSSSELWPQKLHPGLCQGPKDATPSSRLLPTPGHTTHSAHSIHALRVCKGGPSPCASQHTVRASQVGLLSARGEGWCPGRPPQFWGVSRHPSASSPFLSESLPVQAFSPKNRAHRKTCTVETTAAPCPQVPLADPRVAALETPWTATPCLTQRDPEFSTRWRSLARGPHLSPTLPSRVKLSFLIGTGLPSHLT